MNLDLTGDASNVGTPPIDLSRDFCERAAATAHATMSMSDYTPANLRGDNPSVPNFPPQDAFIEKACPADASADQLAARTASMKSVIKAGLTP
jgi:hypothetical protein